MSERKIELKAILNDNKSGSSEILKKLKKHLLKNVDDLDYLTFVIRQSEKKLFHFAAVKNFIREFTTQIKKSDTAQVKNFLEKSISLQENASELIFKKNKKFLKKFSKITTISYSKTLLEIFKLLHKENPKVEIYILESRPILEGRDFAKELIKIGVKCNLVVDAMMNYAVKNSDVVIIGADQILKNGNVVNKIGSFPLALCANENKKPVIVISSKDKIMNKAKFTPVEKSESEIWQYKNKKLGVINYYFEEVPKKLISRLLTE